MTFKTRFAPSPTGPLHLGHAYSALVAHDLAVSEGGVFLLRIEDIDQSRARPEWEAQIYEDLAWLGLTWPEPVMRQSSRLSVYKAALEHLWTLGLLYECTCNRRDIQAAASAPQEGSPLIGPDGIVYPGTCRTTPRDRPFPENAVLRLDTAKAMSMLPGTISYRDSGTDIVTAPDHLITRIGDVVLSRRDMHTSYHLSVVVDDAEQGISHVVRGEDLRDATPIHVLLQRLLGLPTPVYYHHLLIRDDTGKRLAKRDDARAIRLYRDQGETPSDIRERVGFSRR